MKEFGTIIPVMDPTNADPLVDSIGNLQRMIDAETSIMGYHSDVIDGPEGVYVAETLPEDALEAQFRKIVPLVPPELGASDTHHEVNFGTVQVISKDGQETEVAIGIKHFDDATENAVGECNSLIAARKLGFDALEPAAIVKESETSAYLITFYRPDIRSLDNEDWTPRQGERGHAKLIENLTFIGHAMGTMHARGLFHGDAQPKNFVRSDVGHPVVIDLEDGCTIADTPEEHVAAFGVLEDEPRGTALHDLKLLWRGLNRPIGLRDENIFLGQEATPDELYSVFRDQFVEPYLEQLERDCDPVVFAQLNVKGVITELDAHVKGQLGLEVETR